MRLLAAAWPTSYARHAPIRPADHDSFDTFFAAVEKAWIATWRRAYAMRAERERAALL